jgi:hypothetical protein
MFQLFAYFFRIDVTLGLVHLAWNHLPRMNPTGIALQIYISIDQME